MLREEFLAMRASGQGISGFDGVGMAYPLMSGWFENNTVESITMPVCYCEDANYDNSGELKKMATGIVLSCVVLCSIRRLGDLSAS
jgi:hypothetical protein